MSNNDDGVSNTLFGKSAGLYSGAGTNWNVFIGENAGDDASLSSAYENVGVGYASLGELTTGDGNIAVGAYSMYYNTTGPFNVAIGDEALGDNTVGRYSVAVGYGALEDASRAETDAYNTAVGYHAGNDNTNDITTGQYNVLIGAKTAASVNTAVNQIVIGYNANGQGNNYAVIGNSNITRLYVAEDGAGVLYADGTIQSSDRRIKRNIKDVSYGLNYITSLRPVTYYKKHPRDYPQELKDKFYPDGKVREVSAEDYDKRQIGFIAQEVKEVNEKIGAENNIVSIDEDGFHRMDYQKLVVPLIKAVQELSAKVDRLESLIEANSAEVSVSQ